MFLDDSTPKGDIIVPQKIKGLIFDMDGTLVNSIPAHYKAWTQACKKYNISFTKEYFLKLTGRPVTELSKHIISQFDLDVSPLQLVKEKEALVDNYLNHVELIKPVIEVIDKHAGKLPMAVGTGASRQMAERLLLSAGIIEM